MSVVPFRGSQERLATSLPHLVILLGLGCGYLETSALINRETQRRVPQDINQQRPCADKSRTAPTGDKINSLCVMFDMPLSL